MAILLNNEAGNWKELAGSVARVDDGRKEFAEKRSQSFHGAQDGLMLRSAAMAKFECDQCGARCKGFLIVEVEDIDLMREPNLLAADINEKTRSKTLATVLEELSEPGRCLVNADAIGLMGSRQEP